MTQTKNPLKWFYYAYFPRLIMCILIAIYVCLTPTILSKSYFYPLLIFLFMINEALIYLMIASRVGFYARISDPAIGGTYVTLLSSLGNLGSNLTSSVVLFAAERIKSPQLNYPLLVGICFVLGLIWMWTQYRTLTQLQALPLRKWHLTTKSLETAYSDDIDDVNAHERCIQNEDTQQTETIVK